MVNVKRVWLRIHNWHFCSNLIESMPANTELAFPKVCQRIIGISQSMPANTELAFLQQFNRTQKAWKPPRHCHSPTHKFTATTFIATKVTASHEPILVTATEKRITPRLPHAATPSLSTATQKRCYSITACSLPNSCTSATWTATACATTARTPSCASPAAMMGEIDVLDRWEAKGIVLSTYNRYVDDVTAISDVREQK